MSSLYEELYLECTQFHVVSHLRMIDYPVDLLYFRAFERTDNVYTEIMEQRNTRFEYNNNVRFRDFPIINISVSSIPISRYSDARETIMNLLNKGKVIFIRASEYYIPHRKLYKVKHTNHSLILDSYKTTSPNSIIEYTTIDNTGQYLVEHKYCENTIQLAFDHCTTPNYISYLDYGDKSKINIEEIVLKTADYFNSFKDNLTMFNLLPNLMREHSTDISLIIEELKNMGHLFSILSGSRYAFKQYLVQIQVKEIGIIELLEKAYKKYHQMTLWCYKAMITKKINVERFITEMDLLREVEIILNEKLQTYFSSIQNYSWR